MPIYDYACGACGQVTEVIHGIDAAPPRFCPACGTEGSLRKAFVAPAVHFKGSGWAKKDRSSSSRASAKPADAATGESGDGAAKKGDGAAADAGSTTGDAKGAGAGGVSAKGKPATSAGAGSGGGD